MSQYLKRIVDEDLQLRLESIGATIIVGPKWCGKTTTAMQKAKSVLRLNDPDMRDAYLATAETKPSNLLKGENPRLLDEWQEAPALWDAVRTSVDERGGVGLYILTGSTTVKKENIHHSGTGRISRLKMFPMSLYETGESNGEISLSELFNNKDIDVDGILSNLDVNNLIFAACRGGWPSSLTLKTDKAKLFIAGDYLNNICESDISSIDGVERSHSKTRLLLRSYARNISTLATNTLIISDINANESMSEASFYDYYDALKRLFVLEDVEAWCPNIRSRSAIRSSNKREFVDPSIAVAALGVTPDYLQTDLKTFGFIFECLCIRDLKVYSNSLNGKISYYRDKYGLESDVVLHLDDGRYALIECKLGSREIEEGAAHLVELKVLIEEHNKAEKQTAIREPDLLIVLTGGQMAYKRKDGVYVIPVGCLKQ
ncbi:MAG TPA: ATP-binding protein [Bacillota bacterium]|nr:ATP-binding protein [Bacillota bacterium]